MKNAKDLHQNAIQSLTRALIGYERGTGMCTSALPQAEVDRYRSTVEAMFPVFRCHILRELTYLPEHGLGPLHRSPLGVIDIANERRRQVEVEGFTAATDDAKNPFGELALAAACYAVDDGAAVRTVPPQGWPWARHRWAPRTRREDLVRAGALIAAEIDRLDRLAAASAQWGEDRKREESAA